MIMQNSASAAVFIAVLMVLAGVTTGLQPATNGLLTRTLNSPINAAFASFLVGTVILGALILILRPAPDWRATAALPWYAWLGGAYGAFYIAMSAFAAPRIGTGPTIALLIAGQAAAALAVDQFGLFGLPRHPIDLTRAVGMAAVVGGVLLVRRG
jgi:transporter family-2 protein